MRGPYISIIAIQVLSGTKVEEESCLIQSQVISIFFIPLPSLTEPLVSDFWLRWYIFIFTRLLSPWTSSLCTHPRISILSWSDIYLGDSHHYGSCISITTCQSSYLNHLSPITMYMTTCRTTPNASPGMRANTTLSSCGDDPWTLTAPRSSSSPTCGRSHSLWLSSNLFMKNLTRRGPRIFVSCFSLLILFSLQGGKPWQRAWLTHDICTTFSIF